LVIPWFVEQRAEFLQSSEEEPDHGRARTSHPLAHLSDGEPLQVMQLHDAPLARRQLGEGGGEPQQLLGADGAFARGGLVGGEQSLQARGRLFEIDLEGTFPSQLACLRVEASDGAGQGIRQDGAEPGEPLGLGLPAELGSALVGLEERLLDDVGGVQLGLEAGSHLEAGEQAEVIPIALQGPVVEVG
jgi:hypothetical protein